MKKSLVLTLWASVNCEKYFFKLPHNKHNSYFCNFAGRLIFQANLIFPQVVVEAQMYRRHCRVARRQRICYSIIVPYLISRDKYSLTLSHYRLKSVWKRQKTVRYGMYLDRKRLHRNFFNLCRSSSLTVGSRDISIANVSPIQFGFCY